MSRLLILGVSPLPFESTERSFGPGTRTWQLTEPLLDDGHDILLVGMRIPMTYPDDAPPELIEQRGGLTYASITGELYFQSPYVQNAYDEFQPDAVIFAHGSASFADSILDASVPVWIDLCGHVMAEAQAKAAVYGDDSYLDYFFSKMLGSLFRGDVFSTVSDAQGWALVGELGMAGRLNSLTDGVRLVHTIPCGVEEDDYRHERTVLRGIDVEDEDFVVLWSGGFNTWTDIDTMFEGLSYAMDRDPSIRFVATGGQIDGHDEITYPRFVELIEASPHRDRFILKGWLQRDLVPNYYFEADVGINCEKDIYEVRLGSKHRILDWSRAGLPVVSTRVTELSTAVEEDGVGFICKAGDPVALGKTILAAAEKRDELPQMGERCRQSMRRRYGFRVSTEALRVWAAAPAFAPDHERTPSCLQAMLAEVEAAKNPADGSADGGVALAAAVDNDPSGAAPLQETRLQWIGRVVRKSYEDGGMRMILTRALDRFARHQG
jgi:glycosyltransferase involved in cell wall biosynthesis